jgi:hypothetical protein
MRTKYLSLITAGLLTILATGCIVSFEPEQATNPVGTEHTVTVELRDPTAFDEQELCEIYIEILEEILGEEAPEDICEEEFLDPNIQDEHEIVHFRVVQGPNTGLNSDDDGECTPSCAYPDDNDEISWTYRSNGVAGTDIIEVCADFIFVPPIIDAAQEDLTEDEFEQLIIDAINDVLGTNYQSEYDLFCSTVSKTWISQRPPNIGAGLSGLFAGQPTPLPTAAAPAPGAPSPVIRPPSTGDAGLAD